MIGVKWFENYQRYGKCQENSMFISLLLLYRTFNHCRQKKVQINIYSMIQAYVLSMIPLPSLLRVCWFLFVSRKVPTSVPTILRILISYYTFPMYSFWYFRYEHVIIPMLNSLSEVQRTDRAINTAFLSWFPHWHSALGF